jgi:hypothetical protein
MDVVLTNCPDPNMNGAVTVGVPTSMIDSQGLHTSPDGLAYEGSSSTFGHIWTWSLRGQP